METILLHISLTPLIICPENIHRIGDRRFLFKFRHMVCRGAMISKFILMNRSRIAILAACELIKWVIGFAILIHIHTHHHNTRFTTTTFLHGTAKKSIALNQKVQFIGTIHHRVVKSESHIPTPSTQRNQRIIGARNRLFRFLAHRFIRIALFVHRHGIDKLSRRWIILQHARNIRRIRHLFFPNNHLKRVRDRILLVYNIQAESICTRICLTENQVSFRRK